MHIDLHIIIIYVNWVNTFLRDIGGKGVKGFSHISQKWLIGVHDAYLTLTYSYL